MEIGEEEVGITRVTIYISLSCSNFALEVFQGGFPGGRQKVASGPKLDVC